MQLSVLTPHFDPVRANYAFNHHADKESKHANLGKFCCVQLSPAPGAPTVVKLDMQSAGV